MAVIRGVRHALLETIFPTTELLLYINIMFIVEMMYVFPAAFLPKNISVSIFLSNTAYVKHSVHHVA